MNKKFKQLSLVASVLSLSPVLAYAAVGANACGAAAGNANAKLNTIMTNIGGVAFTIGIALATIGFIVAGILYLTAGGGERMGTAKKALIAAVIGTFLVALASGVDIIVEIFCKLLV